jgi:hypothetical protein
MSGQGGFDAVGAFDQIEIGWIDRCRADRQENFAFFQVRSVECFQAQHIGGLSVCFEDESLAFHGWLLFLLGEEAP